MNTNDKFVMNMIVIRGALIDLGKLLDDETMKVRVQACVDEAMKVIDEEMVNPDEVKKLRRGLRIDDSVKIFQDRCGKKALDNDIMVDDDGIEMEIPIESKRLYFLTIATLSLDNLSQLKGRKSSVEKLNSMTCELEPEFFDASIDLYHLMVQTNRFIEMVKSVISSL